jgi:hypothetical protein
MACEVPIGKITGVKVTNSSGTMVLWSGSTSVPHWQ